MTKRIQVAQLIEGTRAAPGRVLQSFSSEDHHACGGPNTACLRAFSRVVRRTPAVFFRTLTFTSRRSYNEFLAARG